jgi:hypothetical protein
MSAADLTNLALVMRALSATTPSNARATQSGACPHHFHAPETHDLRRASDTLACCKCGGELRVACHYYDPLATALRLVINGGYSYRARHAMPLADAAAKLGKLAKMFLKPIVERRFPPPWQKVVIIDIMMWLVVFVVYFVFTKKMWRTPLYCVFFSWVIRELFSQQKVMTDADF